jgi:serine/threonine protein kinase
MEIEMGTGPRRFPYHELVAATKSFAPEEKLGQGGFGSVYRGHLGGDHNGGLAAVAIKRFAKGSSTQGRKEYKSEIKVISRLRHRNLVQLVGWCHGREELLLVYELVPNRSLDVHLHGNGGTFLTWPMRVRIVLGLGSALLYLHEEWEQCVVHRDVKPSNVMLDESFNAKLGDFGLARFIDHAVGMQTMTAVSGTPGYVDPESLITGKASAESDVYSFGVVVLEVACGRRPMSLLDGQKNAVFRLVEWVWDLYGQGAALTAADERLNGEFDAAEMERVVAIGLWCAHPDPRARPSVREAMAALQSNGAVPALPAKMPVPTYAVPVTSPEGLFSYTASTSGMTSSSLTQSTTTTTTATTHTSCSVDPSTSTVSMDDSSSLLKHQY